MYKTVNYYLLNRSGIYNMPHNAKVHYNYANYLKDNGRTAEAISHYNNAVKLAHESLNIVPILSTD